MLGGAFETTRTYDLQAAWPAVVEVIANAYGVEALLLTAQSRGRGWRPPERAREPKKAAIFVTVMLCGLDYAAVGRHLGLHKDTVASHCAELRDRTADDLGLERELAALAAAAAVALELRGGDRSRERRRARIKALQAFMSAEFAMAEAALDGASDEASDPSSDPTKNHANVIGTRANRRAAA